MPRYFTHYWTNETWERRRRRWELDSQGEVLDYAASNRFFKRGIEPGDFLYPVTMMDGRLYLLGRLEVDQLCDLDEAASILGTENLWEASDYAIASAPTPVHFGLEVPPELTKRLTFIGGNETKPLKFGFDERLDQQTLRGVRGLRPESAAKLDRVLSSASQTLWKEKVRFEVGRVYDRRTAIHEPYGGQQQGGISTPADQPSIFLFTGHTGEQYGYKDGWDENGVFLYTGEGQVGNMEFTRGNRAIRDHAKDGKDLHLFESLGKGHGYRYLGQFACSTWEFRQGIDLSGNERRSIVFHLIEPTEEDKETLPPPLSDAPLDRLRQAALEAASQAKQRTPQEAKSFYHQRSATVRQYVLARAGGACESCGQQAPFLRANGAPYLEPHHTRRISDGGPDHPRWVGAICPNCHREIHYGAGGGEKNKLLQENLALLESS